MLNVNEIKKDSESNYLVLQGNESRIITFVSDDEKVPKVSNKGKKFSVREFNVRTKDGELKKLSLFSKDALKLVETVAKSKELSNLAELDTIIDVVVKITQVVDLVSNNKTLSFSVIDKVVE